MREIEKEIGEKLDEIEKREGVRILHAVESGSRAWGFASPDSDYDVRFVYVRTAEDYLRIDEPGDVIEWQLDEVLDINGWDLKKALRQFARGNATLYEWSGSPIVYRTTRDWEKIREVSGQYFSEKAAVCHYYGTANSTLRGYLLGDRVRYKKYFYALRPLLAAQYIEKYHAVPPVLFDQLLELDMPLIDLIYLKYLKAAISYYKETRVETYPFARDAVREAVFNALIHCNWADNVPVQIRIKDNAMYISNCSMLPFGWTVETLLNTHVSKPYNPDIARVFYRAGYIESWGRGIQKIRDACKSLGADDPEHIVHGEDIMVKFSALQSTKVLDTKALNGTKDVTKDVTIEIKILALIKENASITTTEMARQLSVNRRTIQRGLDVLKRKGTIERKGGKRYGYWEVYE